MRKIIFMVVSILSVMQIALLYMLTKTYLFRNSLPYNSEGRYFDVAKAIVYEEQSVLAIQFLMVIVFILVVVFIMVTIKMYRKFKG